MANPMTPKPARKKVVKRVNPRQLQYDMGYDAGLNGANETNCNFRLFATREATKEWERGHKNGLKSKPKSTTTQND